MRILPWAVAVFIVLIAAAPADQSRRQTFVVQVCDGAGHASAIGAGVVVARDADTLTLATAAHVIEQHGTPRILDQSRTSYYEVLGVQTVPDYDLALVRVRAHADFDVAPPAPALPENGEPVWIWGHTGTGFWRLATGTVRDAVAQIPGTSGGSRITIECETCSHGDSGSGVFDAQGRLLGILTRAWSMKGGGPVLFIEVEPTALVSDAIARR
ncbi:MAG TPA: serine protease [Candidatus Baltobacteraceae bacterium]|nr:serine protease [Candidatus Baltobacteraceae bacterium]